MLRKKTSTVLRERVKLLKKRLPRHFRDVLVAKYPEYDSMKGANLLTNVLYLRSSDLLLTERLEGLVQEAEEAKVPKVEII